MKSKTYFINTNAIMTKNLILIIFLFSIAAFFTLSGCNKEPSNSFSEFDNSGLSNQLYNKSSDDLTYLPEPSLPSESSHRLEVCIEQICFMVEIADSAEERAKGLMYREALDEGKGMLFVYPEEGIYNFWMKNTLIPLDMIWISSDRRIVHIEEAVPCKEDPCYVYQPAKKALFVLEINGGLAEKLGIDEGDMVEFNLNQVS